MVRIFFITRGFCQICNYNNICIYERDSVSRRFRNSFISYNERDKQAIIADL